jgi:cell division protein FtsW (lipid II flippase)
MNGPSLLQRAAHVIKDQTDPHTITMNLGRLIRVVPRSRNIEATLVFFVLGLYAFELAQVQLSTIAKITPEILTYWLPVAVLALLFHLVLRIKASESDSLMLPIGLALNTLGISEIYRIDIAKVAIGGTDLFGVKQVIWSCVALAIAMAVIWLVPSHLFLRRYIYVSMIVGIVLLVSPMLPFIGLKINGAQLWLSIAGLTFQPGELAKIALTIFFAGYLVTHRESLAAVGRRFLGLHLPQARELGPILVIWISSLLVLVVQRDLGTSLLYFGLFLVMIYVATARASYVYVGMAIFALGAFAASRVLDYVGGRFDAWLNPFSDVHYNAEFNSSYQLVQGLFGMAHGGIWGTGLGGGVPQMVPVAESDFIIASLGEELGLIGLFAIFGLYLLLVSRGLRIAFNHSDDFSKLLGIGLSFVLALQTFIVVGGVTRVVPLTGLTTPFLAAGGSSLLANWIIIGLLLRISDSLKAEPQKVQVTS